MKINTKIIIGILALAAALRIPALFKPLFGDAIQWSHFYCTGQYWFTDIGYASLAGWLTNACCLLFGAKVWAIRLPFLLVSLAVVAFAYIYGKRFFSEKAALLASLLLAASPWLVGIGSATMQDNYLMLFFTIGLFAYLSWLKKPCTGHIAVVALMLGLSCITKTSAVLLPAVIGFHQLWRIISGRQKPAQVLRLWPLCLGLIVPVIYYAVQFALGSTTFTGYTVHRSVIKLVASGGYSFPLASWVLAVVVATPALFALFLLAVWRWKGSEAHNVLLAWVLVPALVYSFLIVNNNIERFLQVSLPAIALLSADFVISILPGFRTLLRRRGVLVPAAVSAIMIALSYLAFQPVQHPVPYYSLSAYVPALLQPHRFLFPVISDMGPTYYIPFLFVIVSVIVAFLWLAVALHAIIARKRFLLQSAVACLLVSCIATGAFVVAEQHLSVRGPDIAGLVRVMNSELIARAGTGSDILVIGAHQVDYPWRNMQNASLNELHLAIHSTESGTYFDPVTNVSIRKQGTILLRSDAEFISLAEKASGSDIVLFEDFPQLPENNILKKSLSACTQIVTASSRGLVFSLLDCRKGNS